MLSFFSGETVLVKHKNETPTTDRFGNPIYEITETEIEAIFNYTGVVKKTAGEEVSVTYSANLIIDMYLDKSIGITDKDTFVIRGKEFESIGILIETDTNLINSSFLPATVIRKLQTIEGNN